MRNVLLLERDCSAGFEDGSNLGRFEEKNEALLGIFHNGVDLAAYKCADRCSIATPCEEASLSTC